MSDLFAIHCTTCKTRLQVRDASFVGLIQACPKCGSMVLIEPPAGWAPPRNESSMPTQASNGSSVVKKQVKAPPSAPAPARETPSRVAAAAIDPSSLKETASDSDFNEVDAL